MKREKKRASQFGREERSNHKKINCMRAREVIKTHSRKTMREKEKKERRK